LKAVFLKIAHSWPDAGGAPLELELGDEDEPEDELGLGGGPETVDVDELEDGLEVVVHAADAGGGGCELEDVVGVSTAIRCDNNTV
jgi:hypothetical protein